MAGARTVDPTKAARGEALVVFRLTRADKAALEAAALEAGCTASALVRSLVLERVRNTAA